MQVFKQLGVPAAILAAEHWLGQTAYKSTVGLVAWGIRRLILKGKAVMTPTETGKIGTVGAYSIGFSGGKAQLGVQGAVDNGAVALNLTVSADASVFIDQVFAAIEKASPAGAAPIEEGVKTILKAAIASIA